MKKILAFVVPLSVIGIAHAESANDRIASLQSLCSISHQISPLTKNITAWLNASCSVDGIVKLSKDPDSVEWLKNIYLGAKKEAGL